MEDYLKADPLLTSTETISFFKKQVIELKEKGKDYEYIIKSKLQTKYCIVSIHHIQRIHYKGNYLYQLDKFLQKNLTEKYDDAT